MSISVKYDKILGDLREDDSPTFGIADTNAVKVDDSDAASGQYARFTANGMEGVAKASVPADLGTPTSAEITIIKQLTAAEYAALTPKVSTTLYIIVG